MESAVIILKVTNVSTGDLQLRCPTVPCDCTESYKTARNNFIQTIQSHRLTVSCDDIKQQEILTRTGTNMYLYATS